MRSALELARSVRDRRQATFAGSVSPFHRLGTETVKHVQTAFNPRSVSGETPRETPGETAEQGGGGYSPILLAPGVEGWHAGLARLSSRPPPPNVSAIGWTVRIDRARRFCERLGSQAEALGWAASDLFALHPDAPLTRYDAMGAAFLGLDGEAVVINAEAVVIRTRSGGRQVARRRPIPFPPAWETFT